MRIFTVTGTLPPEAVSAASTAAEMIAATHPDAAQKILEQVIAYACDKRVSSPQALMEKLSIAYNNPRESRHEMLILEKWFCSPLNTIIENSGGFRG
jgi:hypothetical protein